MISKHLSILSATAAVLLSLSAAALAGDHGDHGGLCSNATLKGAFPRRSVKFLRVWSLQIPPPDDRRLSH